MPHFSLEHICGFRVDPDTPDYPVITIETAGSHTLDLSPSADIAEILLTSASAEDDSDHELFFDAVDFCIAEGYPCSVLAAEKFGREGNKLHERIAREVKSLGASISTPQQTRLREDVGWPEAVFLVASYGSAEVQRGASDFLNFIRWETSKSLAHGEPNYHIDFGILSRTLQKLARVNIGTHDEIVSGFTPGESASFHSFLSIPYARAITQENGTAFTYDAKLKGIAKRITQGIVPPEQKSRAIFRWIRKHIAYGHAKRDAEIDYRSALHTFRDREGICGESASLQVTMERLVGNQAYLVHLPPKHACAVHIGAHGLIFIDTTTDKGYNIRPETFRILSDDQHWARYWDQNRLEK